MGSMMGSFTEHISRRIDLWLAEDKERTLQDLCRELDMAQTTLRRLRNGESEPNPENVQALMPILDSEMVLDYIDKNWPSMAELFREELKNQVLAKETLLELIDKSHTHLLIVMLCCMPNGLDIRSAISISREFGESIMQELMSKDLVLLADGRYHLRDKQFRLANATRITRMIQFCAYQFYECEPIERLASFSHYPLSYDGFVEVVKVQRKCVAAINKICKDPKYRGDRLFFFGLVTGLLKRIVT